MTYCFKDFRKQCCCSWYWMTDSCFLGRRTVPWAFGDHRVYIEGCLYPPRNLSTLPRNTLLSFSCKLAGNVTNEPFPFQIWNWSWTIFWHACLLPFAKCTSQPFFMPSWVNCYLLCFQDCWACLTTVPCMGASSERLGIKKAQGNLGWQLRQGPLSTLQGKGECYHSTSINQWSQPLEPASEAMTWMWPFLTFLIDQSEVSSGNTKEGSLRNQGRLFGGGGGGDDSWEN